MNELIRYQSGRSRFKLLRFLASSRPSLLRSVCLPSGVRNRFYRARVCEPWKVVRDDSRGITAGIIPRGISRVRIPANTSGVHLPTHLSTHRDNPLTRLPHSLAGALNRALGFSPRRPHFRSRSPLPPPFPCLCPVVQDSSRRFPPPRPPSTIALLTHFPVRDF